LERGGEKSVALPSTLVAASSPVRMSWQERCLDLSLTILLLPAMLIVGAGIALAIYIDSPGPVLYRSVRVGRGGVLFEMLKFRKMRREALSDPITLDDDDRFTPIGRFLAATRLDELPQVWNVLRGEMRLVGPRPELECFVAEFADQYAEILTVTPGVTGDSQLRFLDEKRLLGGPDPASTYARLVLPAKIEIDLDYARSHSLAGDVLVLARTATLPVVVLLTRLHLLRLWIPAMAAAVLLGLGFVLASSYLP
jgi:lipopolysaccharide/colanic/teichoic acid biosynthesis glycosyltransferase